ncbi:GspE/PulE family protein [Chromobacterium haemolyticum]|uniref:GspE/PulE family protein n=1 Tax=Chromobacterium haemolyticum TaxID=394935 RepID=UPI0024496E91|nr:ATPase, T2SS/T4P/T4SS family [Chromobacterium haemolyticum]MDH0341963.1 ATPase, T2SS/T4P/T4SS family [Chromobacterium haemolyticum]
MGAIERPISMKTARVLTGDGGVYELPPNLREMMCLTEDGQLHVSASHGTNHHVLGFMERLTLNKVRFRINKIPLSEIKKLYESAGEVVAKSTLVDDRTFRQSEVVNLIREAVDEGCSDIHFVVRNETCHVRFRINGTMETVHEFTPQQGIDLCSTIYQSMCDEAEEFFKPNRPQDGRLKNTYVNQCGLFGARVATRPTDDGLLMVLRLLTSNSVIHTLPQLGYLDEQVALIRRMKLRTTGSKGGVNVFGGPTGSGKSTSVHSALTELLQEFWHEDKNKGPTINLLTVEHPPEKQIEGAVQTPLIIDDGDEGQAWGKSVTNLVRLDPDVIFVGEMRDRASAKAAISAAQTGHGVWTTLHANDCVAILERLRDMGVEDSLLTDPATITGLINQSLVRVLCPECRRPFAEHKHLLPADLVERIEQTCDVSGIYLQGPGCNHPKCKRGVIGRSVVAEVLMPTQKFMRVFKEQGKAEARLYWVNHMNGITKNKHLILRINQGLVDPRMAEADVCPLDEDLITLEI